MKMLTTAVLVSAVCFGSALQAATVLVDRPLPVSNLNNDAGLDRSNVAWAETTASDGTFNWAYGDHFSIGAVGQSYSVSDLRVWVIGNLAHDSLTNIFSSLSLMGGKVGSTESGSAACADTTGTPSHACVDADGIASLTTVNTDGSDANVSVSPATYDGGLEYQSLAGDLKNIFEVTFHNLTWNIEGGTNYAFFLSGIPGSVGNDGKSPFLSASNAGLSGNVQEGADGLLWELAQDANTNQYLAMAQWNSLEAGWNKASDINVQIIGTEAPEPGTLSILAVGLAAFGLARRRKTL